MYRRRRTMRRRRYPTRRRGAGRVRLMSRVARRTIYRMAEKKFLLNALSFNQRTTANVFSWHANATQGVARGQYIGQQIRTQRYSFRLFCNFVSGSGGVVDGTVRISVIFPRKNVDSTSITGVTPGVAGSWDPDLVFVMYDKTYSLSGATSTASGGNPTERTITYSKAFKQVVNMTSASSPGRVPFLVVQGTISNVDTSYIDVNGYTRMSYIDA